jgi:YVTN family beta-propeller protein
MVGIGELEFCILGPIEVCEGERKLPLGGPKQRALLADLILSAGTVVSTARLIDDVWEDAPPATAGHTVETYIARLRRLLRNGSRPEVLLTRPPGYLLDVTADHVDALRFGLLAKDGAAAAGRGEHEQASAMLGAALALWRGQVLEDVADRPFAQAAAKRLTDQYLIALERRIDADLHLGGAQDLVPELESLAVRHPYHESFHRQLMLALYRSGRQSDALNAFRRARSVLAAELGLEPGPDLRKMQQAILLQDPGLDHPSVARMQLAERLDPVAPGAAPSPAAASGRWRPRRIGLIATGLAVAVVIAVAVPLALRGVQARASASAGSIGILSASGTSVTAALAIPSALGSLAAGAGSVWATSPENRTVYRIDPATRAITQTIRVGAGANGMAYDDGDLWVANAESGTVSRISSKAGLLSTIGIGSAPTAVAAGLGEVWVTDQMGSAVYGISPSSGRLMTATLNLPSRPYGIAVGAGSLWATSPGAGTVMRIDPLAHRVLQAIPVGADPTAIAFGFGSVWVANELDGTVTRIDPGTDAVTETIPVGDGPAALAVASTGVWVADAAAATVVRIDPATGRAVSSLQLGDPAVAVAVVHGLPWVGERPAAHPSSRRAQGGHAGALCHRASWPAFRACKPGTWIALTHTPFRSVATNPWLSPNTGVV